MDSCFPQEIFDKIIDYNIHQVKPARTWALVCRAFVPRAQKRLFQAVTIRHVEGCSMWLAYFDESPHLAAYPTYFQAENEHDDMADWKILTPLIGRMPSLTTLVLHGYQLHRIPDILQLPQHLKTLRSLQIQMCDLSWLLFATFCAELRTLEYITFVQSSFTDLKDLRITRPSKVPGVYIDSATLESADVSLLGDALGQLLPSLKRLRFYGASAEEAFGLVHGSAPSLEELTFDNFSGLHLSKISE